MQTGMNLWWASEWRTKLLTTRQGHGPSGWSGCEGFHHQFQHPKSTPYYFCLPLISPVNHLLWAQSELQGWNKLESATCGITLLYWKHLETTWNNHARTWEPSIFCRNILFHLPTIFPSVPRWNCCPSPNTPAGAGLQVGIKLQGSQSRGCSRQLVSIVDASGGCCLSPRFPIPTNHKARGVEKCWKLGRGTCKAVDDYGGWLMIWDPSSHLWMNPPSHPRMLGYPSEPSGNASTAGEMPIWKSLMMPQRPSAPVRTETLTPLRGLFEPSEACKAMELFEGLNEHIIVQDDHYGWLHGSPAKLLDLFRPP